MGCTSGGQLVLVGIARCAVCFQQDTDKVSGATRQESTKERRRSLYRHRLVLGTILFVFVGVVMALVLDWCWLARHDRILKSHSMNFQPLGIVIEQHDEMHKDD